LTSRKSESNVSTVAELESRLREIKVKFLGPLSEISNPFAPVSSHRSRIEHFKSALKTPEVTGSEVVEKKEAKLPAVQLPVFDGSDLDSFLKDFERWL